METSGHGSFAIVDCARESAYGVGQGAVVRLTRFLLEPYQRPMFFTVEDNIPWTASVIAAAAF